MKISDIDVFTLGEPTKVGGATWAGISIVLRLTTSDGVVGYGEAVPTLRVRPVVESLKEVGRLYKGKDPSDFELIQHEWHKHDFYLPVSFESTTALSAFDIACWDIVGRHHGVPIHRILGGAFRDSTTGLTRRVGTASPYPTTPSDVVRRSMIEMPAQVAPPAFVGSPRVKMSMSVIFMAVCSSDGHYIKPAFLRRDLTLSLSAPVSGV